MNGLAGTVSRAADRGIAGPTAAGIRTQQAGHRRSANKQPGKVIYYHGKTFIVKSFHLNYHPITEPFPVPPQALEFTMSNRILYYCL
jgi:hypothetical protein